MQLQDDLSHWIRVRLGKEWGNFVKMLEFWGYLRK